jgi:hypothetical protein
MGNGRGRQLCGVLCAFAIGLGFIFAGQAGAQVTVLTEPGTFAGRVEIIRNQVPNLTNVDVYTVPAGMRLRITDVVVSNSNVTENCCARIGDGGFTNPRTAFLAVPAEGYFQHSFLSGINYPPGAMVSVRNGSSSGTIDFYLRGILIK